MDAQDHSGVLEHACGGCGKGAAGGRWDADAAAGAVEDAVVDVVVGMWGRRKGHGLVGLGWVGLGTGMWRVWVDDWIDGYTGTGFVIGSAWAVIGGVLDF